MGYVLNLQFISGNYIDLSFKDNFNIYKMNFQIALFVKIIFKNLIVALLLSIGGYFSSGILTIVVLITNGFYLGSYFISYHYSNISLLEFAYYFIFHGIIEFYAFFMFCKIGYRGFNFYYNMIKKDLFKIDIKFSDFVTPIFILTIAALIETFLISNF